MFYVIAKLGWLIAAPSRLFILGAVVGVLLSWVRPRPGRILASVCVGLLLVASVAPVGEWLLAPLETRFPPAAEDARPVAGVVVLGGATSRPASLRPDYQQLSEAGDRLVHAARLARLYPAATVVVSGGRAGGDPPPEAEVMARFLMQFGIAPRRIVLESRSIDTFENAVFSRAVAHPRPGERWLLVTSAFHMPRAIGCFRRAGFPVEAAPADWRRGRSGAPAGYSAVANLQLVDLAAKEYLGLLAYRLWGRTNELFPRP